MEADISMYTDDHQIFTPDHSIDKAEEKLLQGGNMITDWYKVHIKLQVNIKKYQMIVLGHNNNTDGINMHIGGVKIAQSPYIKV